MKDLIAPPKNIVIAWHPSLPKAKKEAGEVLSSLREKGMTNAAVYSINDAVLHEKVEAGEFDLLIALGGDGTMIRAGKLCAPSHTPVMGINMGSVGFLIEIQKNQWRDVILDLLCGKWKLEERMMLHAEWINNGQKCGEWEVLNDAVVARAMSLRPVHLSVMIGDQYLTDYSADGLIVSTATGSTAYSMAVGGPILQPESRNMILVPIAPSVCLDRALVLQEGETVSITNTAELQTLFSPDGYDGVTMEKGDQIIVSASKHTASFVRFHDIGFFYQNFIKYMQRNPSVARR